MRKLTQVLVIICVYDVPKSGCWLRQALPVQLARVFLCTSVSKYTKSASATRDALRKDCLTE